MAQVTMDIAELDKLREEIKDKGLLIKKLEEDLVNVKADKRIIKIYVAPDKSWYRVNFDSSRYHNDQRHGYRSASLDNYVKIEMAANFVERSEFVNFDDAKAELKEQLEQQYATELAQLRSIKANLDSKIADKQQEIKELSEQHMKVLTQQDEIHKSQIEDWKKRYTELETGKKELSRIEELTKAVNKFSMLYKLESDRKWWEKLLGLNKSDKYTYNEQNIMNV